MNVFMNTFKKYSYSNTLWSIHHMFGVCVCVCVHVCVRINVFPINILYHTFMGSSVTPRNESPTFVSWNSQRGILV